jgi:DNA anti-recombination protein RmuC
MKKKKETIWELVKRLDEQAGQFNMHLHKANHYFDRAATKTAQVLYEHEKQLHKTIVKVKKAIRVFRKENKKK